MLFSGTVSGTVSGAVSSAVSGTVSGAVSGAVSGTVSVGHDAGWMWCLMLIVDQRPLRISSRHATASW